MSSSFEAGGFTSEKARRKDLGPSADKKPLEKKFFAFNKPS